MGGSSKAKFFHKDVIDELLPEAWGLLQGDLVERGWWEDMASGNRSEAFSFDPPFSKLDVDGHIDGEKHKFAFEAVAVTVQYRMDNGSPLYDV